MSIDLSLVNATVDFFRKKAYNWIPFACKNKTKDWALVQNAALIGVKVNLGYVGLSWLGNLT